MTLRNRLFIYLVMVSVIPVLLVGGISYYLAFRNISDNAVSANLSVTDRVSSDVEKMLENCFNMANSLEDSIPYQEAMRRQSLDLEEIYATELKVSLNMYVEAKYRPELFGIYLISENGCAFKSSFCTLQNTELRNTSLYNLAFDRDEMSFLGCYSGSQVVSSLDYPMLAFGKAYRDKATGQKSGVIILEIEREKFEELLSFDIGSFGFMAMADADGTSVAYVGDKKNMSSYFAARQSAQPGSIGESSSMLYSISPIVIEDEVRGTGFSIICIVPSSEIIKNAQYISLVISLVCMAVIAAALLVAWNISGKVTRPIKKLVSLMHKVEVGDLTVFITPKYNDEIGMLFRSFNIMVEKVNTLMLSIQDEQKKLRASEMRALMNQINPHFLYNTLDSIVWLCRARKTEQAAIMTDALANFFRIGLSKGRDIISIEEELLHVKNYIMIQGLRGKDSFDYNIDADESLYKYSTIKFILQPLVENAIYHGIYKLHKKGHISIGVYEENEKIVMSVSDTGIGMMPAAAEKLRWTLDEQMQKNSDSYGLVNVNQRIKKFFGEEYGLRFFSVYGKGSTFEIVVPKYEEGQNV